MSQESNNAIIDFPQKRQVADWDNSESVALIRRQIANELTDAEFDLFLATCRMRNLNPITRDLFAIIHSKNNPQKRRMTIVTGIDGFSKLANRTGKFAGSDKPKYEGTTPAGFPAACELTVWKMVDGQRCPFTVEARWEEFVALDYNGQVDTMWKKMPYNMLSKCALAKALRLAFPEEIGGLYTSDEMAQAQNPPTIKDVTPPQPERPRLTVEVDESGQAQLKTDGPKIPITAEEAKVLADEVRAEEQPIQWGTGKALDPESAKFFINKWGSEYAAVLCSDADPNNPERAKALAWFHAKLRDEYHLDHKQILSILGVKSLKAECPDWPLGFVLEQVGLLKD